MTFVIFNYFPVILVRIAKSQFLLSYSGYIMPGFLLSNKWFTSGAKMLASLLIIIVLFFFLFSPPYILHQLFSDLSNLLRHQQVQQDDCFQK